MDGLRGFVEGEMREQGFHGARGTLDPEKTKPRR